MKKFLLFLIPLFFTACAETVVLSPIDLVTAGSTKAWTLETYTENGKSLISDCIKDDVFFFKKDSKEYVWKKGAIKCSNTDKDENFSFDVSEDGKTITFNGIKWDIVSLSETKLEIKSLPSQFSNLSYTIVYKAV
jgi:hypothetical protein